MLRRSVLVSAAALCGAAATIVSAAEIPNPKYDAALRRVDKKCGHLDAGQVQQIRETAKKMHAEGVTRSATKKACKELISEWPTDFKACANAVIAVEYVPERIQKAKTPAKPLPRLMKALAEGKEELERMLKDARSGIDRWGPITGQRIYSVNEILEMKKGNYLVTLKMRPGHIGTFRSQTTITQVVDKSNMIVSRGGRHALWIEQYSTTGLTDGSRFQDHRTVFEYAGTKQYNTASGGTNTVHVIRPFPLTAEDAIFLRGKP